MGIKDQAARNPTMALLTTLAALAVAGTGIWNGVELADALILTEAEAALKFDEYDATFTAWDARIDEQARLNECRWLADKIQQLEYEIYVLERDGASPDFIQSKRSEMRQRQGRFNALRCAQLIG